jgi:regulator of protease activity HflC (stomatin/prohibitin superfamily)
MSIFFGMVVGFIAWFFARYLLTAIYTINQNERAVKTIFGRAERVGKSMTADSPLGETLSEEHRQRYNYPQVRVIPPGGPYFKWPWEKVHRVSIATQTINMAYDPETPKANLNGTMLEAVH